MKISILTLFSANNVGAFLQAFSLQNVLIEIAPSANVSFIRFPSSADNKIGKVAYYLKKLEVRKIIFKYLSSKKYARVLNQLRVDNIPFSSERQYDTVIVGSDEVWNIDSNNFTHHPQYFAHQIRAKHIISYAASANTVEFDSMLASGYDFCNFESLSVRDDNTFNLVKKIDGRTPQMVCDPTMLINSFDAYISNIKMKNYILVYSYELTKRDIRAIKEFAKKKKKKLISVGTYNKWCDKNIVVNPFEFLSWLSAADLVITSTFHGTVLSIRLHKQVAVFAQTSHKVKCFLNQMGLNERCMDDDKSLDEVFTNPINYDLVEDRINFLRTSSIKFLKEALENSNGQIE